MKSDHHDLDLCPLCLSDCGECACGAGPACACECMALKRAAVELAREMPAAEAIRRALGGRDRMRPAEISLDERYAAGDGE